MKPSLATHLFALVAFFLAAAAMRAANQPPERFLAFPDLSLARGATPAAIPLADHLRDPDVPGTAARINVRMADQTRTIDLALHDAEAPLTVANFVAYVNAGRYAANFFHRSVPGFIIQNGGFYFLNDTTVGLVPTYAPVQNEPGRSNLRGTVAMAKLGGDPDSATSQWFINLADNSANLDAQNGGFTVFAHVLGDGMTVADAIAATPFYNRSNFASAWTDLPLTNSAFARSSFIETDTAIVPALSHIVTSDDPELVTATLENGALRLAASASRSGSTTIRIVTTDLEGGSLASGFAVTVTPSLDRQPGDVSAYVGTTAEFSAQAAGQGLAYQWFKSGVPLIETDRILGTTGPTLTLAHVISEDAAIYTVSASIARRIDCWGDSMTEGYYPTVLAELTGLSVLNGGIGGQISTQIRDRMLAATSARANHTVIWAGRNNSHDSATVLADVAAMVAGLDHPRYLILGLTNGTFEPVGSGPYNGILSLNRQLAETYGDRFIDIRSWLISRGLETLNLTPTPQDLLDSIADIPPATLRRDTLHLNDQGNRAVAIKVFTELARVIAADAESSALSNPAQLTVLSPQAQSINFTPPASATFGDAPLNLSASASSGLPVSFTLVSGPATLSENTLTLTGAGTVVVRATQTGDANFNAAPAVERTLTVAQADQSIAFAPPTSATFGEAPLTLTASATSGLPVTSTLVSGPAALSGATLALTGAGSVVLRATQAGDANHNPAPAIERTLTVAKADHSITFTPPASATFGDAPLSLSATASSDLPVTFTVVSGPAALTGSTLTLTGAGPVVVRSTQAGDNNYNPAPTVERTITISQTPSAQIALTSRSVPYAGIPQAALATTTPPGLQVAYTYKLGTAPAIATTPTFPGVYTVTATLDDPAASNKPTATATLTITKAPLTISAPILSRAVGSANPTLTLAYSGLLGADTPATALTGVPVAATKANAKSAPGNYPITLTGGASNNYTLTLVPGAITVVGFGGSYEALLLDAASVPVGKLTLTIPANTLTYSGSLLLARETTAIKVASTSKSPGTTAFAGSTDFANAAATWTRTTTGLDALELALTVSANGTLAGSLDRNGELFATLARGARLRVFTKGQTAPGAGANTLALHPAYNLSDSEGSTPSSSLLAPSSFPHGSGFATAPIAPTTGVLTLKGFTADGSPLTASLKPTLDDTYLLWVNPYGTRAESFLAGALPLEAHPEKSRFPGRAYIPRDAGLLTWQKADSPTKPLDKSYRAGFGPLGVTVSLDPWLPPAARAVGAIPSGTLAQRLGLAANATSSGALTISHGPDDLDLGARETRLPFAATLSPAGVLTAANASATAWTIKLTPATGAFTGSFILRDPAPTATKPSATADRKVTFSGVLRQAPADETDVATGFFLVPGFPVPKGSAPAEQPSGEIRFSAP